MSTINPVVQNDELGSILSSLTHKYEVSISSLPDSSNANVEEVVRLRSQKVQEIALDIASDLTILAKYRLGQDTKYNTYYLKHIDAAIQYLKELRQTISLYITAERL